MFVRNIYKKKCDGQWDLMKVNRLENGRYRPKAMMICCGPFLFHRITPEWKGEEYLLENCLNTENDRTITLRYSSFLKVLLWDYVRIHRSIWVYFDNDSYLFTVFDFLFPFQCQVLSFLGIGWKIDQRP